MSAANHTHLDDGEKQTPSSSLGVSWACTCDVSNFDILGCSAQTEDLATFIPARTTGSVTAVVPPGVDDNVDDNKVYLANVSGSGVGHQINIDVGAATWRPPRSRPPASRASSGLRATNSTSPTPSQSRVSAQQGLRQADRQALDPARHRHAPRHGMRVARLLHCGFMLDVERHYHAPEAIQQIRAAVWQKTRRRAGPWPAGW